MTSRGTPILMNRSLLRPILLCGVERKAGIIYMGISTILLIGSGFSFPKILIAPLVFIFLHYIAVFCAKKDPQMVEIYSRHIRYRQGFYPARGGIMTNPERIRIRTTVSKARDAK